jgi:hypothetical protein
MIVVTLQGLSRTGYHDHGGQHSSPAVWAALAARLWFARPLLAVINAAGQSNSVVGPPLSLERQQRANKGVALLE